MHFPENFTATITKVLHGNVATKTNFVVVQVLNSTITLSVNQSTTFSPSNCFIFETEQHTPHQNSSIFYMNTLHPNLVSQDNS